MFHSYIHIIYSHISIFTSSSIYHLSSILYVNQNIHIRQSRGTTTSSLIKSNESLYVCIHAERQAIQDMQQYQDRVSDFHSEKNQKTATLEQKLHDLAKRKSDYLIYVHLAVKFGPLSEPAFNKTATPGREYTHLISQKVRVIEQNWQRHWPRHILKRTEASRVIQRFVRTWQQCRRTRPVLMRLLGRKKQTKV